MVEMIDFRIGSRFVSQIYYLLMTSGKQMNTLSLNLLICKVRMIVSSYRTIERIIREKLYKQVIKISGIPSK